MSADSLDDTWELAGAESTFLLVDLEVDVGVKTDDDSIRQDIQSANAHQHLWVFHRDLF